MVCFAKERILIFLKLTSVADESRKALQIFESDNHPSVMGISGGKEGLSLFGVMNDAESIVGKRMLKRWFLQPTLDDSVLHWRQDVVALFLRPDLHSLIPDIKAHLKKIKDVPGIIIRMEKIQTSVTDWISLFSSLHNMIELQKFLGRIFGLNQDESMQSLHAESMWIDSTTISRGLEEPSRKRQLSEHSNLQKHRPYLLQEEKLLKAIIAKISPQLINLVRLLKSIINFEDSKHLGKLVVQSGIDEYLDTLKDRFFSLPDLLTSVAMEEMSKIPVHTAIMLKVEFVPQIG
jgi:DNA mismatch repair ATPase MutS